MVVRFPKFSSEHDVFRKCFLSDLAANGPSKVGDSDGTADFYLPALLALAVRVKRGAAHALEIFEGKAKLGEHFFMGNGRVIL